MTGFDAVADKLIGAWAGGNVLRLSWLDPQEYSSPGELSAARTVGGKYLALAYTWSHEDAAHEGLLLIGHDAKSETANAAWVDSWHASAKPLALSGAIDGRGAIDLRGTYEVPGHPDWGWRIIISAVGEDVRIVMYNVSPEGEEDLAVRAEYRKQSND